MQKIRNPVCESPSNLFIQSNNNQPEAITNRIISELGGLPKTDMDVYEALKSVDSDHTPPIYPVNEWTIESSSLIKMLGWFMDGFPHDEQWAMFSLTAPRGLLIEASHEFDVLLLEK